MIAELKLSARSNVESEAPSTSPISTSKSTDYIVLERGTTEERDLAAADVKKLQPHLTEEKACHSPEEQIATQLLPPTTTATVSKDMSTPTPSVSQPMRKTSQPPSEEKDGQISAPKPSSEAPKPNDEAEIKNMELMKLNLDQSVGLPYPIGCKVLWNVKSEDNGGSFVHGVIVAAHVASLENQVIYEVLPGADVIDEDEEPPAPPIKVHGKHLAYAASCPLYVFPEGDEKSLISAKLILCGMASLQSRINLRSVQHLHESLAKGRSTESIRDILCRLDSDIYVNRDILNQTRIDRSVIKFRKHVDKEVAALAKRIVTKWKSGLKTSDKTDADGLHYTVMVIGDDDTFHLKEDVPSTRVRFRALSSYSDKEEAAKAKGGEPTIKSISSTNDGSFPRIHGKNPSEVNATTPAVSSSTRRVTIDHQSVSNDTDVNCRVHLPQWLAPNSEAKDRVHCKSLTVVFVYFVPTSTTCLSRYFVAFPLPILLPCNKQ